MIRWSLRPARIVSALVLVLSLGRPLLAQRADRAVIGGVVTDEQGAAPLDHHRINGGQTLATENFFDGAPFGFAAGHQQSPESAPPVEAIQESQGHLHDPRGRVPRPPTPKPL